MKSEIAVSQQILQLFSHHGCYLLLSEDEDVKVGNTTQEQDSEAAALKI